MNHVTSASDFVSGFEMLAWLCAMSVILTYSLQMSHVIPFCNELIWYMFDVYCWCVLVYLSLESSQMHLWNWSSLVLNIGADLCSPATNIIIIGLLWQEHTEKMCIRRPADANVVNNVLCFDYKLTLAGHSWLIDCLWLFIRAVETGDSH